MSENIYLTKEGFDALGLIKKGEIREGWGVFKDLVRDQNGLPIARLGDSFQENTYLTCSPPGELSTQEDFRAIKWCDFAKQKFPEAMWTIKNIIPAEGIVIFASPSGEKKTWVAMAMAIAIATGKNFLNQSEFEIKEAKNVLYIDQEMGKREFQRRGKLLGFGEQDNLWLFNSSELLNFTDEGARDRFFIFLKEKDIRVIFIDTFRPAAEGLKEDDAMEIRKFFQYFKQLKNEGVSMVFLDHCRKPRPQEGYEPKKEQLLASQDKVACAEALIMLKSKEGQDSVNIYVKKMRCSREIKPFALSLESQLDNTGEERLIVLNYEGMLDDETSKKEAAKDAILDLLRDVGERRRKELIEFLREQKIGEKNTSEALRELEGENKILMKKIGRENAYYLPKSSEEEISVEEAFG